MTQTGLRIPEELNRKLEARAKSIGVSKNAFLLVLVDLGMKSYDSVNPPPQQE